MVHAGVPRRLSSAAAVHYANRIAVKLPVRSSVLTRSAAPVCCSAPPLGALTVPVGASGLRHLIPGFQGRGGQRHGPNGNSGGRRWPRQRQHQPHLAGKHRRAAMPVL